jgi:hypothetical protein
MNTFDTVLQFSKMLRNFDTWLEKASDFAKKKPFEPDVFLQLRLAPDQFPLVKQIQSACDAAKFAAAYLSGQKAPSHPDTETTFAQARERIRTVLAYLETFKEADFAGAAERKVAPPWLHGKWVRGDHYLAQLAIPNFYFHLTTGYAILRHNGVDVGKMDYIGPIPIKD